MCSVCGFQSPPQPCEISTGGTVVKSPPASAGDVRDTGSIPGPGRSPGGGHGNPLQENSCLENPRDRGAWRATAHRVAKSQTRLKRLSTYARCPICHVRKLSYTAPRQDTCSPGFKPNLSGFLPDLLSMGFRAFSYKTSSAVSSMHLSTDAVGMFQMAGQVCRVTLGGIQPSSSPLALCSAQSPCLACGQGEAGGGGVFPCHGFWYPLVACPGVFAPWALY